jgi:hypothetical protein
MKKTCREAERKREKEKNPYFPSSIKGNKP